MPAATRLLMDIRPLQEVPAFRRLWTGSVLSSLGGTMTDFAVTLQVWRLTHAAMPSQRRDARGADQPLHVAPPNS